MEYQELLKQLADKFPALAAILVVLGTLVVLATVIAALTKTQKDDEILAKVLGIPVLGGVLKGLMAFSVIQAKSASAVKS